MYDKSILFSLSVNEELANRVATNLGIQKGESKVRHFEDGEIIVDFKTTVRGKIVYIVQSTSTPNVTESLMELLIFVDGLRRASAKEIIAIIPYYGYSRQDRKSKPHEPITARLVADFLTIAGIDRLIVIDLHAPQIQGFFKHPVDDISAVPMFGQYFKDLQKRTNKDFVVVSPDHGGVTRARRLTKIMSVRSIEPQIAIIDKRRPKPNEAEVMNIIGDVKGKSCIIIDDICDTANTLIAASNALIKAGALEVYAAATHPILSGGADKKIDESVIKELLVTDSIPLRKTAITNKIKVLSVDHLIQVAIDKIESGSSLSDIYNEYNQ